MEPFNELACLEPQPGGDCFCGPFLVLRLPARSYRQELFHLRDKLFNTALKSG